MVNVNLPSKLPLIFRPNKPAKPRPENFKAIVCQWPCIWRSFSFTGGQISVKKQKVAKVEHMVLLFQTCIRISFLAFEEKALEFISAENPRFQQFCWKVKWHLVSRDSHYRSNHVIGEHGRSSDSLCSGVPDKLSWNSAFWLAVKSKAVRKYLSDMGCKGGFWVWYPY